MEQREMRELLEAVAQGTVSAADAAVKLETAPVADLGYARVDNQRGIRRGVSEVVYGAGKTPDQIAGIVTSMLDAGESRVLITRIGADAAREVEELLSDGLTLATSGSGASEDAAGMQAAATASAAGAVAPAEAVPSVSAAAKPSADAAGAPAAAGVPDLPVFTYYDLPRVALVGEMPEPTSDRTIVVCSGGTSDIPVAEEAALTAEVLGCRVERLYDVGVAGLHRLLSHVDEIERATAIVAVAGMEGALPSVVAGLASCPVVAVPTSVGYGASFGGVSALLSMLNSCAAGVSVVNIDNGFGAGYQASLIVRAAD